MSRSPGMLLDGHVHLHACFELDGFLDSAVANLRRGAVELDLPENVPAALMFTESAGRQAFSELREAGGTARWTIERTDEPTSLLARRVDAASLILVAGRQVVTREGLEVLALNSEDVQPDGGGFHDTVEAIRGRGSLPVVPWGFGKWWFRRGAVVAAMLERPGDPLFLGDNAGRWRRAPRPVLFREARSRSIWVLPGSDPLPFPAQEQRVGGYGCHIEGTLVPRHPARSLTDALRASRQQPRAFGELAGLGAFCRDQLAMQLRKRVARAA